MNTNAWRSLPCPQDWFCSLACKIKAIQIESKQNLLPPLSIWRKLEDTVSDPGQWRAGAWPTKAAPRDSENHINDFLTAPVASCVPIHSPGTTGVVVRHEAESIDDWGQLLKLLPAKHARLPCADNSRKSKSQPSTVIVFSIYICWMQNKYIDLVTAGGITRTQSNLLAFKVSHMCFTKWTSSLFGKIRNV